MSARRGTHFEGPILGNNQSSNGLLEDAPIDVIARARSPYKVQYEDFQIYSAAAQPETSGWTISDIGTSAAATEVTGGAAGGLFINPGTTVDTGTTMQFKGPGTAASLSNVHNIMGSIVSTATLMDSRELFFEVRLGYQSNSATSNDGKFVLGWIANQDSDLVHATTGLPLVPAAGGGFGFFKNEAGLISVFSNPGVVNTQALTTTTGINILATTTVNVYDYIILGARSRWTDASESEGTTTFYVNHAPVVTINDSQCMDSTETFHFSFAAANGPTNLQDYVIDYILTGITRPGLTYPYNNNSSPAVNLY
jgi:hypothetical protein